MASRGSIFSSDCSISQCLLSTAPPAGVAGAGPLLMYPALLAGSGGLVGVKLFCQRFQTSLDAFWLPTKAAGRLPRSAL